MTIRSGAPSTLLGFAAVALLGAFGLTSIGPCEPAEGAAEERPERPLVPPNFAISPAVVPGWDMQSCAMCHATIAEEWAHSAHGLAWLDTHYQKDIAGKRRPESCHGCHIPTPMHQRELGGKPPARKADDETRDHGISCKSCHLGPDGVILGPWGEQQESHTSVKHSTFDGTNSNALCIACHRTSVGPVIGIAKDFEVAGLGGNGETCIGCHMSPVTRSIATDDDDLPLPPREGRSHRLLGPRDPDFLAAGFGRRLVTQADGATLVFTSVSGHRVPGLKGREIVFRARLEDVDGNTVARGELTIDARNALRLGAEKTLVLEGQGAQVHLEGWHKAPGFKEPVRFLDESYLIE